MSANFWFASANVQQFFDITKFMAIILIGVQFFLLINVFM